MSDMISPAVGQLVPKMSLFGIAKKIVLTLSFVGLVVSNILSLTSDAFHAAAYGLLNSIGSVIDTGLAARVLRNSPTEKVNNKIGVATKNLNTANASLAGKNLRLENDSRVLNQRHAQLQATAQKRIQAVKKFTTRTLVRTVKTTSLDLVELPARVVPYLGVAVTVAATAYNIRSDCEMLQEMNDMVKDHEMSAFDITEVCGVQLPTADELWKNVKSGSNRIVEKAYGITESYK